jgi:hypothetical protein
VGGEVLMRIFASPDSVWEFTPNLAPSAKSSHALENRGNAARFYFRCNVT